MHPTRRPLTCRQNVPGVKGKIESVLVRLERLEVESGSTVSDKGESKRRKILFEWVLSVHCE